MTTEYQLRLLRVTAILVAFTGVAHGATFEIAYSSIERMITRYLMTDGGRYYMQGDASTPCRYAFIQDPRVEAVSERLRITFLFSGKAAVSIGGQCRGAGDNFDIQLTGIPTYSEGELYLSELSVKSVESSYFRVAAPLIRRALEKRLRVPLKDGLERLGAYTASSGVGSLTFDKVAVDEITVEEDQLRMSVDFEAALRP